MARLVSCMIALLVCLLIKACLSWDLKCFDSPSDWNDPMDMKMINRYVDSYFSVWLYVCYVWCNESSIGMEICLKIVGLTDMLYPMSGKVGKKERLAVITTEKQIV